jgi:acyl carrier protein phosphodiesterase
VTMDQVKRGLRHLIKTIIVEEEALLIELLTDGIPDAVSKYKMLLARYHVQRTAEIVLHVQYDIVSDACLAREIQARIEEQCEARPDDPITIKWAVDTIFAAHSARFPELNESLADPDWLISCAIAGLKDLVRDLLAENGAPNDLKSAYLVAREGEEVIVPSILLTAAELSAVAEEDREIEQVHRVEFEKVFR